jgi:hypothetical protein
MPFPTPSAGRRAVAVLGALVALSGAAQLGQLGAVAVDVRAAVPQQGFSCSGGHDGFGHVLANHQPTCRPDPAQQA